MDTKEKNKIMRPHSNTPILDKFIAIIGITALLIGFIELFGVINGTMFSERGTNMLHFSAVSIVLGVLSITSLLMETASKLITFFVGGIPVEVFLILNSVKPEIRIMSGIFLIIASISVSVLVVMKLSDIE